MIVKAFGTITLDTELLDKQIAWICDRLAVPDSHREEAEGIYNLLTYIKDKVESGVPFLRPYSEEVDNE